MVVAFETVLDEYWVGWRDAKLADLFESVRGNGVHQYGFPESRLTPADENRNPTATLSAGRSGHQ